MLRKGIFHFIEGTFFGIGIFIFLNSMQKIIGFAIIEERSPVVSLVVSLWLIAAGFLTNTLRNQQVHKKKKIIHEKTDHIHLEINVYSKNTRDEKDSYVLYDPSAALGQQYISLGQFRESIKELKKEGANEIISNVKKHFIPKLKEISKRRDKRKIALAFLRVIR